MHARKTEERPSRVMRKPVAGRRMTSAATTRATGAAAKYDIVHPDSETPTINDLLGGSRRRNDRREPPTTEIQAACASLPISTRHTSGPRSR